MAIKKIISTIQQNKILDSNFVKKHYRGILIALIIIIGILFRFYQLDILPPGLHADEAANGIDVFKILEKHDYRVVYDSNGPRQALFFYLQAIFVAILGNNILALRIAPALIGIASIIMVYLYSKDWFGDRIAFWASFFMAVNPWVVTISRDGYRASLVPFFIAAVLFFGGRAYKTSKARYFILAGISFALGFYTYHSYNVFGFIVFATLTYLLIIRDKFITKNVKNLILAVFFFVLTIFPLARYVINNPSDYSSRTNDVSILNLGINSVKFFKTLTVNTAVTLWQFNFLGDQNSRHNPPGIPLLNIFVSLMFLLGLIIVFKRRKKKKYLAMMLAFFSMLLPSILTADGGLPHALRSFGTAATVFTIAAIGIDYCYKRQNVIFDKNFAKKYKLTLIALVAIYLIVSGWLQYFYFWGKDPRTYTAYHADMVALANYINEDHSGLKLILISNPYRVMTAEYLTHKKSQYQLMSREQLQAITEGQKSKFLFVAEDNSTEIINVLFAKYSNGQLNTYYSPLDHSQLFYSFEN